MDVDLPLTPHDHFFTLKHHTVLLGEAGLKHGNGVEILLGEEWRRVPWICPIDVEATIPVLLRLEGVTNPLNWELIADYHCSKYKNKGKGRAT